VKFNLAELRQAVADEARLLREETLVSTAKQRFLSKVVENERGCWVWQAGRDPEGYGEFWLAGRGTRAHRAALVLFLGLDPGGSLVMHSCDNPSCARPEHLVPGTQKDNIQDSLRKGRRWRVRPPVRRGDANNKAKLSDAIVVAIRRRYAAGGVSVRTLAREYRVTRKCIQHVLRRQTWAHVA
jgi:hypothetical protein